MMRELKFSRRDSDKGSDEIENIPVNSSDDAVVVVLSGMDVSRPPLNTIQEPNLDHGGVSDQSKTVKTPPKSKGGMTDATTTPLRLQRTPDKHGNVFSARNRFGWGQKIESDAVKGEVNDEARAEFNEQLVHSSRGIGGNGGFPIMTPRSVRTVGRANSSYCSENNSTQNTPAKSVIKHPNTVLRSKVDGNGGGRAGSIASHCKGMPITCSQSTVVNTVEVPHFDLKEDSSFWMEHNVQVLIRIRPLSSMEKSVHGFNRCLKQESSQTVSWVGQPETRFTFDNVACETVDQEMLFRTAGLPMVENCLSGYNSCMFAYGQTGSGKTYTMLGEIDNLEVRPSLNRGMTPRIFEFLFARIRAEEEIRRDERLQYNCKCSFLEIYNEQITDLLDSSSSNLLVREDMTKGVYVENLSEFEVQTVGDILKLLLQGSLNRKVAATNMNKESSRSHSVFTCVIESRWVKDSTNNLRFARLNLVDLAGSERQKTSGAEGERLKEAANINKSLSTLGHVIMVLLDVAQGKPKHIPYRDSRLTFLLQDSLGGNSKTMIIANVSPSIGCAAETLNTLKFAQRAKFIQNNAVVNEDSSGDVTTLQHQIRLLKEELSILKRQNISRSLSFGQPIVEDTSLMLEDEQNDDDLVESESRGIVRISSKQFKSFETTLAGALRREQMAETSIKQLEAEIEQLKRLVRQREEDTRCTKMTLRFREDKINRMESLLGGSIPADTYLRLENTALSKENELLQAKVDRNPEVTRFALENIRLLEQLRRFQDFYEEGEREILLAELSQLREQFLKCFDGNSKQQSLQNFGTVSQEVHITNERDSLQFELEETLRELGDCRSKLSTCLEVNEKLTRDMHDLRSMMNNLTSAPVDQNTNFNIIKDSLESAALAPHLPKAVQNKRVEEKHESLTKHMDEIVNFQLELDILKLIVKEEKSSRCEAEEKVRSLNKDLDQENKNVYMKRKECGDLKHELEDAKSIIEALESQQIILINEMEDLKNISNRNEELLSEKEHELRVLKEQMLNQQLRDQSPLQAKLKRMQDSLETAKKLNMLYQTDRVFQTSNEEQMDEIGRQAEAETAEVIVCLQEELSILEQEVQDSNLKEMESSKQVTCLQTHLKELEEKICLLTQKLEDKDLELTTVSQGWELLTGEIEELLADGHEEVLNASAHLDHIADSYLKKQSWVSGQVGRMIRMISEKEQLISELRRYLDDANKRIVEVESMLRSLRGAALAITEAHQQELTEKDKTIPFSTGLLCEGKSIIEDLENKITKGEDQLRKVSACATAAFVIVNRLHEMNLNKADVIKHKDSLLSESTEMNSQKDSRLHDQAIVVEEAEKQIQLLQKELGVSEENCCSLRLMLAEEQERARAMKLSVGDIEENEILKTRQMLLELKLGVSTLRSSINMPVEQLGNPMKVNTAAVRSLADESCDVGTDTNLKDDISRGTFVEGNSVTHSSLDTNSLVLARTSRGVYDRESTIVLLKKEIQSALETLKIVEAEMTKLHDEKQDILLSEKKNQHRMKNTITQVFEFQAAMVNFEEQSGLKIVNLSNKLMAVEQCLYGACASWYKNKEKMELEVGEAILNASEKAAEASCFLEKFAEAQDILKEADFTINKLLIAHERMKFEIEGLKNEKEVLNEEVQSLKSFNNTKDQQYANLEKLLSVNMVETKDLVLELEDIIDEVRTTSGEELKSLAHDIHCMKSELIDITKSMRLGLEDVYTEIVVKDCAVSVLHLCHTGNLLNTVTGLKTENGYLQHGLSYSNAVIDDLREHNIQSRKELVLCRDLQRTLLGDIKKSFDRISKKEEETVELGIKLSNFDKRVVDLQLQEELMLLRSNKMGSELAVLVKDIDISNTGILAAVLDQENLLKETEEDIESQTELLLLSFLSKDFQSLILELRLVELAKHIVNIEWNKISCCSALDNMKELTILKVDMGLKELLLEYQGEVSHLLKKDEVSQRERQDLLLSLKEGRLRIAEMDGVVKSLEQSIQMLKDVASSSENLSETLHQECTMKETALELSQSHFNNLELQTQKLQDEVCLLESSSNNLRKELETKIIELENMSYLKEEVMSLKNEVKRLKTENCAVFQDLEEKKYGYESSLDRINVFHSKNGELQDKIVVLESRISNLQSDINLRNAELHKLQNSHSVLMEDSGSKTLALQVVGDRLSMLKEQNDLLINELDSQKKNQLKVFTLSSYKTKKSLNSVESLDRLSSNISNKLANITAVEKVLQEFGDITELTCEFIEELDFLGNIVKDMSSENLSLQTELRRKDDIIKGMVFDLSLLQESAANNKNQKDEIREMMASLEALKNELLVKSDELDEAVNFGHTLEGQLNEKIGIIFTLELEHSQERESVKYLSNENIELRTCIEDLSAEKTSIEDNLTKTMNAINGLEQKLVQFGNAFSEMNASADTLKKNVNELTCERDQLQMDVLHLKGKLDMAEADAEANEAIAVEAQQIAQSSKLYAEEKEEEVKLLEKSVEELENTVDVLENKVDIVKGEATRQRLQREELELELHAVRYQLQNVHSGDDNMQRHLDEKEIELRKTLRRVQTLEIDITDREAEIFNLKSHISELNLHAEAQACEYKQKFKALEDMVEQVKLDSCLHHVTNSSSTKLEKNASKPRGSGSPFKCMGLGLVQQMKSEKDEELTSAKFRIEELEALAVSRQKEIFMLNSRLASAESMTHDVLRDLLEVKLDMTKYASFLDKGEMHKISNNAQVLFTESEVKGDEISRLRQQLSIFNEERAGWVEEIDRKHAELVAAQLALDKLHQREQFLKAESETFKMEIVDHRKKVMDLEAEMKKLSGQQNFQLRIHHHAKIKEENNQLRLQNENLSTKLRRLDDTLSRVKDQYACYWATIQRNSHINFDEENLQ